jgi:hypothetical protein
MPIEDRGFWRDLLMKLRHMTYQPPVQEILISQSGTHEKTLKQVAKQLKREISSFPYF